MIEVDGDSNFLSDDAIRRDKEREKFLSQEYSLKVLRFLNLEVMRNFEGVCEEIERNLR